MNSFKDSFSENLGTDKVERDSGDFLVKVSCAESLQLKQFVHDLVYADSEYIQERGICGEILYSVQ